MTYQLIRANSMVYNKVLALRQLVLRAPLGLNLMDEDLHDEVHQHIAVAMLEDGTVVGCLLAKELSSARWKLRQMAVDPLFQSQGIGRGLMEFMEAEACIRGVHVIELHARETALGFYRILDYMVLGERFNEVGIPHWKMEKTIG